MIIRSAVAVPIVKPSTSIKRIQKADDAYFDSPFRFVDYLYKEKFLLTADDQGDWYLLHIFDCENSEHLSGSRQIIRHDYLKDQKLPLIDLIEESGLSTNVRGYDKAFAHGLCFVENLDEISFIFQQQIANYDGAHDPIVSPSMHYIENIYNGERTRFIAGVETFSFATVTENRYYCEEIWPNSTAFLYLKLFIYFKKYRAVPSNQMMARLLCNLWASAEAMNNQFNPNLYIKYTF
ncbi:hypothetical protein NST62_02100 [Ureibacillus sp. FSL K6-8385]|uniref:Uncharacterized protein n=1 Tax=Ureibacillus terrenus TaxID=118246 RepID=A0A540UXC6_9BACL|nr:hypothetical protein [Ureibacillus terrenus]MED3660541.1 hypothetical protein [Ureibacillus terrenus]MED3764946.1 hypothetical protein [Ureibacillus terrenus]TQE88673.1 hypothetical protein FKZ59_13405 [Ureibacillus terrenus]